ncbi:hypothetical protein ABW20_dc0110445 [Dactylellina cionopaga]|nr:hypothetical protein ABW20_dc0110445 [Dactylellina cionopaga]
MIWKLRVTRLKRACIMAILGLGTFSIIACLFSRIRLILWQHTKNPGGTKFNTEYTIWMAREVSAAVIVGNLYYYAPLVKFMETWTSKLKEKRATYQTANHLDGEHDQSSLAPNLPPRYNEDSLRAASANTETESKEDGNDLAPSQGG